MFEQLARYTRSYQESDFHLDLYSSSTSANNFNLLAQFLYSTLGISIKHLVTLWKVVCDCAAKKVQETLNISMFTSGLQMLLKVK